MAANYIKLDRNRDLTRQAIRAMQLLREGVQKLDEVYLAYQQARDGDGSDAAHYDLLATEDGYEAGDYASANAAAKASFEELQSLYGKVCTNGDTSFVRTAILQCAAKHGI